MGRRRFPGAGEVDGAGWTADSGGGERPEELHQVRAAAGGEVGVGGGERVVISTPHPDSL